MGRGILFVEYLNLNNKNNEGIYGRANGYIEMIYTEICMG